MNEHDKRPGESEQAEVCPECGSSQLRTRIELENFKYGSGENVVELEAAVPVTECARCHYNF